MRDSGFFHLFASELSRNPPSLTAKVVNNRLCLHYNFIPTNCQYHSHFFDRISHYS